ncbi:MAG: MATE family efflux transporter [Paraprevotella sp.]|nr:MATE family efflux transporter [Paraprevotella sp.]
MKAANKVAFNSIALYTNMVVSMGVSLYTTRFVLDALGQTDYGIYALIANIVAMFSFLNVAMAAASQRYLSYAIGENNSERIKETFYSSMIIHLCIALCLAVLLSSFGLLFINHILDIPSEAIGRARVVLLCMLTGIVFTITGVPYEAEMNAHEDIFVIAGINMAEAILKFIISVSILYIDVHRLIVYSFLIMGVSGISFLCKRIYSRLHYRESHYRWHLPKDFRLIKEMTGFAGWNLIGAGCSIARYQGTAVLLNIFFGIIINAAYGIAQQVNGFLLFFANSTVRPLRPQIIKSEGAGNHTQMIQLSFSASRLTFLMLAMLIIPLYINMPHILGIWLKETPEGTLAFCRAFLLITLIGQLTIGLQIALESVGRIRHLQLLVGSLHIIALPCGYFLFRLGYSAYSIMYCIIAEECVALVLRTLIARKDASVPLRAYYTKLLIPCTVYTLACFISTHYLSTYVENPWFKMIGTTSACCLLLGICAYYGCLTNWEKEKIHSLWVSIRSRKL